jgi:hypothetical protein
LDDIVRHLIGGALTLPIALLVELQAVNALNRAYYAQRIDYREASARTRGRCSTSARNVWKASVWPIPAKPLHPRHLRHRLADLR